MKMPFLPTILARRALGQIEADDELVPVAQPAPGFKAAGSATSASICRCRPTTNVGCKRAATASV